MSEQDWADRAARNIVSMVETILKERIVDHDDCVKLGAEFIRAEAIRSSASDARLREAAKEYLHQIEINDGTGGTQQDYDLYNAETALRAALSEKPRVCEWGVSDSDLSEYHFDTGCGESFSEKQGEFCPYCGLPISVKEK